MAPVTRKACPRTAGAGATSDSSSESSSGACQCACSLCLRNHRIHKLSTGICNSRAPRPRAASGAALPSFSNQGGFFPPPSSSSFVRVRIVRTIAQRPAVNGRPSRPVLSYQIPELRAAPGVPQCGDCSHRAMKACRFSRFVFVKFRALP
jgi:hypothetical protein